MNLLQMSFFGAVFIIVIVIIRAIAINKLPKKTFLVLWEMALFRLLIPFSIPSMFSVYTLIGNHISIPIFWGTETGNVIPAIQQENQFITVQGTAQFPKNTLSSASVCFAVWLIGMILVAIFFTISYLHCLKEFQTSLPICNDYAEQWLKKCSLRRPISIRQSDRISAPLTYGIFRPVILMPKKTNWENTKQIQYILTHEYVHIYRFDAIAKLVATIAFCIHWFNPMVWVMYILFNRDIELACDESVVRQFGDTSKSAYARLLIDMEAKQSGLFPFCNSFSKNAIEERIKSIMKIKKATIGLTAGSLALVLIIITLFITSTQKPQDSLTQLEKSISYLNGNVQFTIPDSNDIWNIQISGRIDIDGNSGMSVHFLTDESESSNWENGKIYSFDVSGGGYTELDFYAANERGEISVNIMELIPDNLKAVNGSAENREAVASTAVSPPTLRPF